MSEDGIERPADRAAERSPERSTEKPASTLRRALSVVTGGVISAGDIAPPNPATAYSSFDLLATLVAVIDVHGECLFANTRFESSLGLSRRSMLRRPVADWFVESMLVRETVEAVVRGEVETSRLEAHLRRSAPLGEPLPVYVVVTPLDAGHVSRFLVELVEIEQQARLDREARTLGQAQATKELIRNLAHEIKNPLGGIRGAAQLLGMEVGPPLTEYTQVIIHEADRLQSLVDRLLAPHRKPQIVGDVNIHEVLERIRSVILAEFPRGLAIVRDYDVSLPEFRGDREQLIQAVLNIVRNAAEALSDRIVAGDAEITLRTRIARQVTIGKQRWRLALELHIHDNGPGVPVSIREHIFYPLVSGREGGSGLGLTLAQTFVQQHQGTVECDSEPGNTTFLIVIPLP
jgi:two-component system, NtrC family, nitrogen regulation sensor histidine kinase GlnL